MLIEEHVPLHNRTSLGVGGPARRLVTLDENDHLPSALNGLALDDYQVLGYGTNVLISDSGLPGTTLLLRDTRISVEDDLIVSGAGAWWDDLVKVAAEQGRWGVELMSGIPGSVGAGIFININAYGQGIENVVAWVDAWDPATGRVRRFEKNDFIWGYKHSLFQDPEHAHLLILRAGFLLGGEQSEPLTYQSALDVAEELGLDTTTLPSLRRIILETRARARSIFIPGQGHDRTAGSFFRNPLVSPEQAEHIVQFDETGKTREQIRAMNEVHGGNTLRVSAAHVLLAAGFSRGQTWGNVRLHPGHILKIENTGRATAQEIFTVAMHIIKTVNERLDITLEPEVRILGDFS